MRNLAIERATVTTVKESTYALGLYGAFAWLSDEARIGCHAVSKPHRIPVLGEQDQVLRLVSKSQMVMESKWCFCVHEVEMRPANVGIDH